MHTTLRIDGETTRVHCTCKTFSTKLPPKDDTNEPTFTCCHSRLLKDAVTSPTKPCFINLEKLESAKLFSTSPVVKLPSKAGVDRFSVSVRDDDDTKFVTLFNVSRTSKTIVKCHSSICKISEGSCRNVKLLSRSDMLCPHLLEFRKFYLQQVALANEEGGLLNENYGDANDDDIDEEAMDDLPDEKV